MDLINKSKSWFAKKKKSQNRQTTSLTWSRKKEGVWEGIEIRNDKGEIILKNK